MNSSVPYVINKRRLRCFCPGCLTSDAASCASSDVVAPLQSYKLILNHEALNPREPCATPVLHDIKLVIKWISFKLA